MKRRDKRIEIDEEGMRKRERASSGSDLAGCRRMQYVGTYGVSANERAAGSGVSRRNAGFSMNELC